MALPMPRVPPVTSAVLPCSAYLEVRGSIEAVCCQWLLKWVLFDVQTGNCTFLKAYVTPFRVL